MLIEKENIIVNLVNNGLISRHMEIHKQLSFDPSIYGLHGLFVTLSNYTKNAKKYLESTPIIRGINGTELVELVLKYYGQLSEKYRKMIPLKMVYIPVTLDTDSN